MESFVEPDQTIDSSEEPVHTIDFDDVQTIDPVHTIESPAEPVQTMESVADPVQTIELAFAPVQTIDPVHTIEPVHTMESERASARTRLPFAIKIRCWPSKLERLSPRGAIISPAIRLARRLPRTLSSSNFAAEAKFMLPTPTSNSPKLSTDAIVTSRTSLKTAGWMFPRSRRSAAAPLTTAVAMLVPDSCMYASVPLPATCRSGCVVASSEPLASADTMCDPGAAMSGLIRRSNAVGPRELYAASVSSDRCGVPCVSIAPTVSAYGLFPGDVMLPSTVLPSAVRP